MQPTTRKADQEKLGQAKIIWRRAEVFDFLAYQKVNNIQYICASTNAQKLQCVNFIS